MNANTQSLAGRHALITGASRGIGLSIVERFLAEGAKVSLLSRDIGRTSEIAGRFGRDRANPVAADVSNAEQVRSAVEQASACFGAIDILVNNAGNATSAPIHKMSDSIWDAMLAVNLTGSYNCIRTVLPVMMARDFGRIVNIVSTAGLKGYPYVSAYSAAKHGVIGLTRSLALEMAGRNITVNAVCPGYTDTDLVHQAIDNIKAKTGRSAAEAMATLVANNPQRRLIRTEEVAHTALWLCAPGSESVTGQSIAVAGGEVM